MNKKGNRSCDYTFFILSCEVNPEPNENKNLGLGKQTDKTHKDMNTLHGLIFALVTKFYTTKKR